MFKQLTEENPKASESELKKLFIASVRGDPELTTEVVDWWIERNYPKAAAATKN